MQFVVNVHKFSFTEVDECHAVEKNVRSDKHVFTQRKQRVHCKHISQLHVKCVKQFYTVYMLMFLTTLAHGLFLGNQSGQI